MRLTKSTLFATSIRTAPSTLLYSSTSRIHTASRSSKESRLVTSYTVHTRAAGEGQGLGEPS